MTRPSPDSPYSPRLIADYAIASTSLASPARLKMRSVNKTPSPSGLTAGLTTALLTTVEKALSAMARCSSPPLPDLLGDRLPIFELPVTVAENILGYLSADDLCAAALCNRFLRACIPNAATIAAARLGFELQPSEPALSASSPASSTYSVTRRLHTIECQAWLAAHTMEKLSSEDRKTRETAVLRLSSLPLPASAHHGPTLIQLTASPHVEVRLRALRTLSQFSPVHTERLLARSSTAVEAILVRFEDEDDLVRRLAVAVMQAWIAPDAVLTARIAHALRRSCTDTHELVAAAAYRLLEAHEEELGSDVDDEVDEKTEAGEPMPVDDELPIC